jgi:hypothetical protein
VQKRTWAFAAEVIKYQLCASNVYWKNCIFDIYVVFEIAENIKQYKYKIFKNMLCYTGMVL